MKKIICLAILALGVSFASCDYVQNPYPVKNANVSYDTASCPTTFAPLTTHIKKILMEDYTGHTCANCPNAARSIHIIDSTYPGKINVVAIGAGPLAAPTTAYTTDFRTSVGTLYDNFFGCSNFGLPQGLINRKNYNATTLTHLKAYPYQNFVNSISGESSVMDLQISHTYDAATRKVYCSIRDSALTAITGNYRLVALITQDSIIDWQDDMAVPPYPGPVQFYVHRHMLRDAITPTGAWGEPLIGGSANAGLTQIRHFVYTIPVQYFAPGSTLHPISCNVNQCHIVAFIYNTVTEEVIQSEEIKVTP